MAIVDSNEYDLVQLWGLITELSEQLSQNRSLSVSLYSLAGNVKTDAIHSQTGFVLRSFNSDKTQEEYDGELDRMNNVISTQNQGLQHDNKQLNALIKEYEQTLETLMSSFRNRAQDVQERELSLIREYESKLLAREEENATKDLLASTAVSESLARISHILRQFLRSECGEETSLSPSTLGDADNAPTPGQAAEYALEREIELARLEKENEELRRMMGLIPPHAKRRTTDPARQSFEGRPESKRLSSMQRTGPGSGAASGASPYGMYNKRMRSPG